MKKKFGFILIFLVGVIIYLPRVTTTPQNSDGAQFVTAAITNSVVHQPGYPLYNLINSSLVEFFPNNFFYTIAVSSVIYQALSAGILFLAGVLLISNGFLVLLATLAWLIFEPVARTATDVEVFALHHLIIALIVYFSIKIILAKKFNLKLLFFLGISWALGVAHHHTIILWLPLSFAALFASSFDEKGTWSTKLFLFSLLLFTSLVLLGLLSYFSLLFKTGSSINYPLSAPQNISEVIKYFLRTDFGTFLIAASHSQVTVNYGYLFIALAFYQLPALLLSTLFLPKLILSKRELLIIGVFLSIVLNLFFAFSIRLSGDPAAIAEWSTRFFGLVAIALLVSFFAALHYYQPQLLWQKALVIIALIIPIIIAFSDNLSSADAAKDRVVNEELLAIERELPLNAVFIANSDRIAMGLSYRAVAFNSRTDLTVLIPGMLNKKSYLEKINKNLNLNCQYPCELKKIVETAYSQNKFVGAYQEYAPVKDFVSIPVGVVWQWVKADRTLDDQTIKDRLISFCANLPIDFDTVPKLRIHSQLVIKRVFLAPFYNFIEYLNNKDQVELGLELQETLKLVKSQGFAKAAQYCQKVATD